MNPTMVMPKLRQIQLKHGNQVNFIYTDLSDKFFSPMSTLSGNIQEFIIRLKMIFPNNIIITEAQFNKFTNKIKTF